MTSVTDPETFAPHHRLTLLAEAGDGSRRLEERAHLPNEREPDPIGKPGEALYAVRFLGEREVADGTLVRMGPVDDPRLLEGCESVQLWIELSMEPGVAWEPPVVDHVELSWLESAHPGEGR